MCPDSVASTMYNTIDRSVLSLSTLDSNHLIFSPINQISFGISNLLSNNSSMYKSAPVKQISYSSIAKKEPLQPVKTQNNIPRPVLPRASSINKVDPKKAPHVSCKVTETAISAGYRFKARNPEPDPRYPADQQLMVGPIPGECLISNNSFH